MTTTKLGDFTPQVNAYVRARPSYPEVLVDELVRRAHVEANAPVVELGAGTGIFTRLISGRGLAISAIEPNSAMRAQTSELPGVTWHDGTFEEVPLATSSQAWAVAAQAFHWADPSRALPELWRVLRPQSALSVLWNDRDVERSDLLAFARQCIRKHAPTFEEAYRNVDWPARLTSTGHFCDVEGLEERHVVSMDHQRFIDLFRSHNRLNATAGPQAMGALLAALEARLQEEPVEVDIPYVCRAFVAHRVERPS